MLRGQDTYFQVKYRKALAWSPPVRNLRVAIPGSTGLAMRGARGTPGPTTERALGTIEKSTSGPVSRPTQYPCPFHACAGPAPPGGKLKRNSWARQPSSRLIQHPLRRRLSPRRALVFMTTGSGVAGWRTERRLDAKANPAVDPNGEPGLMILVPRRFAPTGDRFATGTGDRFHRNAQPASSMTQFRRSKKGCPTFVGRSAVGTHIADGCRAALFLADRHAVQCTELLRSGRVRIP